MRKKVIAFLLVFAMVLGVMPSAFAADMTSFILIPAQYEDAMSFSDGYAAVKKDGKWGYIDESGKVVIDFQYDWAGYFADGIAAVATIEFCKANSNNYYVFHLIDTQGNDMVLTDSTDYGGLRVQDLGYDFQVNCRVCYEGMEDILDEWNYKFMCRNGFIIVNNIIYTMDGEEIHPKESELSKLYTPSLAWAPAYDWFVPVGSAKDGLIPMQAGYIGMSWTNQYFLMDEDGNIVKTFDHVDWDTGEGIYGVMAPDDGLILAGTLYEQFDSEGGSFWYIRYGFLDEESGDWVIDPTYTGYRYYYSGEYVNDDMIILCNEEELWGALDTQGNVVIPFEYSFLGLPSMGFCAAQKTDGTYVCLDYEGKEYQIGDLEGNIVDAVAVSNFGEDGIAAVMDKNGNTYCISNRPIHGVLPAVENSDQLDSTLFFPDYVEGDSYSGTIYPPSSIVVYEENGLYGFKKLDVNLVVNPFTDLVEGSSYYDAVLWAVDNDITTGTTPTTFSPKKECTRAQIVTFLWRYAGEPEPKSMEHNFVDLAVNSTYYKAVIWAVEQGITTGTDSTHFSPKDTCTRAQIVTFLWRYAGRPAPSSQNHSFKDIVETSTYYDAVLWAVENQITTGADATHFNPKKDCTRAQGMTFLYRFDRT